MNIQKQINQLISYAYMHLSLNKLDQNYAINKIRHILHVDDFTYEHIPWQNIEPKTIHSILEPLLDYAVNKGIISNTIDERDALDTQIMDAVTPMPKDVSKTFDALKQKGIKEATNFFYAFSKATNYIRTDRIVKDEKWQTKTKYGTMDITINLSKPEKDPKSILLAATTQSSSYPPCLLCKEHVGNYASANQPPRNTHRVIDIELNNEPWFFQYSPYLYYNEHCIVIKEEHVPMTITKDTFVRILEFAYNFKHYFIGSNADLPIVGGSILSHEHFQGGSHTFGIDNADIIKTIAYKNIEIDILKWPLTTLRLKQTYDETKTTKEQVKNLADIAAHILKTWQNHNDPENNIVSHTNNTPHNTITPIARFNNSTNHMELNLVLRNNTVSPEHSDGIYHPHKHLHHLKKENIGLIEVMGLAVLPGRLKAELNIVKEAVLASDTTILDKHALDKHIPWALSIIKNHNVTAQNINTIIQTEIGNKFEEILECCGVYKQTPQGNAGIERFLEKL